MTTISLIIALLFICSTGFCNAAKALNESVKITELDGSRHSLEVNSGAEQKSDPKNVGE